MEQTPQPRKSLEQTPQPRKSVEQTPQPRKSLDQTPQPRKSVDQTPQPRKSVEQTLPSIQVKTPQPDHKEKMIKIIVPSPREDGKAMQSPKTPVTPKLQQQQLLLDTPKTTNKAASEPKKLVRSTLSRSQSLVEKVCFIVQLSKKNWLDTSIPPKPIFFGTVLHVF